VFAGVSDDAGLAVVHIPAPFPSPGYHTGGYLQVQEPSSVLSELIFWDFSPSAPSYSTPLVFFTPMQESYLELQLAGRVDEKLGAVIAWAFDCTTTFAPGVSFAVTDPPASPIFMYSQGGFLSPGATSTDGSGFAVAFNVPVGAVTMTATPATVGRPSSEVPLVVRPLPWVTNASFWPNK
jgi:hypothetical protein